MSTLTWDEVGERVYQTGVDRGVLYLLDGTSIPWNGLVSVSETNDVETSPVYFDGMKISDLPVIGDFNGTIQAFTYPDELTELEGYSSMRPGVVLGDQNPGVFNLSYRTLVGNDLNSDAGYKIHILYNVTAIPKDRTFNTVSDNPEATMFEWDITAVPEEIDGFRPTAHFIINSIDLDPWLLEDLEAKLYGTDLIEPEFMSLSELVTFMNDWYRILITDNGDGTWTATTQRPGFINMLSPTEFEITDANAVYLDPDTYAISNTSDITDVTP
jgi:hypothetical protein